MPHLIQFTHPGAEHGPTAGNTNFCDWNRGPHKRKFMQAKGRYVDASGGDHDGLLRFWGEWEPPSRVSQLDKQKDPLLPRWLHEPLLPQPIPRQLAASRGSGCQGGGNGSKPAVCQNTDPWVFGRQFHYFVCKQHRKNRSGKRVPTQCATLEKGSLILFGSTKGRDRDTAFFQLDTVFVVADWREYDPANPESLDRSGISEDYLKAVFDMAFPGKGHPSLPLRLYFGATPGNPVNGMYSFAPAQLAADQSQGFPRVPLRESLFKQGNTQIPFTNNLNSAPKIGELSAEQLRSVWETVRRETREANCVEGYGFEYKRTP